MIKVLLCNLINIASMTQSDKGYHCNLRKKKVSIMSIYHEVVFIVFTFTSSYFILNHTS